MIGYVTLGTNDKARAEKFYDELLKVIGGTRFMETDRSTAYATQPGKPGIGITKPFDGKPATVGNGMMVALDAGSPDKVDALYNKAISLGGRDEGKPGPRGDGGFYAAYFRDLDGNKLSAYCVVSKK